MPQPVLLESAVPQRERSLRPWLSRIAVAAVLTLVSLAATPPGSWAWGDRGQTDQAEEGVALLLPAITLEVHPPAASLGQIVTVTGSVSEGQGSGEWTFTAPTIVRRSSEHGSVLEVVCVEPGSGPVTARYTDESGAAEVSNTITCLVP